MNIYLDIETIPCQAPWVTDAIISDIDKEIAEIKAPGNYKKPEAIEKFLETEKAKLSASFEDRFKKCSLDGTRGEICSIAFALGESDVFVFSDQPEKEIIGQFFAKLLELEIRSPLWIGHNLAAFDLPFIYKRCVINNIKPPVRIPTNPNPWDSQVFDTMFEWSGRGNRISQDNLCRALGLETKQGMTGSDVYDYWKQGRIKEIAEYNASDVRTVREIHKRMTFCA